MTGQEIKALLDVLGLGTRQLGAKLGVDPKVIVAWEREEQFPTKKNVDAMRALLREHEGEPGTGTGDEHGHAGEGRRGAGPGARILDALADPAVWRLLRKILAHPRLRQEVEEAAAQYRDPVGGVEEGGATPCTAPSISTRRHEGHGGFTENGGAGEPSLPSAKSP